MKICFNEPKSYCVYCAQTHSERAISIVHKSQQATAWKCSANFGNGKLISLFASIKVSFIEYFWGHCLLFYPPVSCHIEWTNTTGWSSMENCRISMMIIDSLVYFFWLFCSMQIKFQLSIFAVCYLCHRHLWHCECYGL